MKICTICKEEKDILLFNKNKAKKDGYNNLCKHCSTARSRKYYSENKEHHKQLIRRKKEKYKRFAQKYIRELKESTPCVDCGSYYPWCVMDFDHQRDKIKNISDMTGKGAPINKLKAEIEKCEIVCSNCHRIRTFKHLITDNVLN